MKVKTDLNIKALFRLISRLSNVNRYSTNYLVKQESVLEHTGSVVVLGMAIGLFVKKNLESKLNLEVLALKLTFHDLEESETGDVPRTTKYHNETILNGLKLFEVESIDKIADYTNIPDLKLYWSTAKDGLEGLIVSLTDLMCVTYKVYEEIVKLNNFALKDVGYQSKLHYTTFFNKIKKAEVDGLISESTSMYFNATLLQSYKLAEVIVNKLNKSSD